MARRSVQPRNPDPPVSPPLQTSDVDHPRSIHSRVSPESGTHTYPGAVSPISSPRVTSAPSPRSSTSLTSEDQYCIRRASNRSRDSDSPCATATDKDDPPRSPQLNYPSPGSHGAPSPPMPQPRSDQDAPSLCLSSPPSGVRRSRSSSDSRDRNDRARLDQDGRDEDGDMDMQVRDQESLPSFRRIHGRSRSRSPMRTTQSQPTQDARFYRDDDLDRLVSRNVASSSDRDRARQSQDSVNVGNSLHVRHLPHHIDEQGLNELFSQFGMVLSAKVVYDPQTNLSRGFGFILMETVVQADAAIESLNGYEMGRHHLVVQRAHRAHGHGRTPGRYEGRKGLKGAPHVTSRKSNDLHDPNATSVPGSTISQNMYGLYKGLFDTWTAAQTWSMYADRAAAPTQLSNFAGIGPAPGLPGPPGNIGIPNPISMAGMLAHPMSRLGPRQMPSHRPFHAGSRPGHNTGNTGQFSARRQPGPNAIGNPASYACEPGAANQKGTLSSSSGSVTGGPSYNMGNQRPAQASHRASMPSSGHASAQRDGKGTKSFASHSDPKHDHTFRSPGGANQTTRHTHRQHNPFTHSSSRWNNRPHSPSPYEVPLRPRAEIEVKDRTAKWEGAKASDRDNSVPLRRSAGSAQPRSEHCPPPNPVQILPPLHLGTDVPRKAATSTRPKPASRAGSDVDQKFKTQ